MRFRRKKVVPDPDNDPIIVTSALDPSLDDDEMILHSMIDPNSIKKEQE